MQVGAQASATAAPHGADRNPIIGCPNRVGVIVRHILTSEANVSIPVATYNCSLCAGTTSNKSRISIMHRPQGLTINSQ